MTEKQENNLALGLVGGLGLATVLLFIGKRAKGGSSFTSDYWGLENITATSQTTPEAHPEQFDPPKEVIEAAQYINDNLLEPLLRDYIPFLVSSWYRSPFVNQAVGGVSNSHHKYGRAVDLIPVGMNNGDLINVIDESGLPFTKLIDEGDHVHAVLVAGRDNENIIIR